MKLVSRNPFTEEILEELDALTYREAKKLITASRKALVRWKKVPLSKRAELIDAAGRTLRRSARRYAETMTKEMGKPLRESSAEVEKCAWLCDYYAKNAEALLAPEPIATEARSSTIVYEPLGIILGIMPWNFPFWQVFRFAVPALAAGNAALLKHASNVPRSALHIEDIFREAGVPEGIFRTLLMDAKAATAVLKRDLVDGVSLTGSEKAGARVGGLAGKNIRKIVLELGGSDPFIVLDDADVDRAAAMAVKSRLINGGQSCIAAKRFIVMEQAAEAFREKFLQELGRIRTGDPLDPSTDVGPMARREFVDELASQLEDARRGGATLHEAGAPPGGKGFFFRPVALTNVKKSMRVWREEVFGPIAPIITAGSEADAIRLANGTRYGLGASLWSRNLKRAERIAGKLEAGFVAVNDMVKSDPRLPFGGIKKSGVGRELSHVGLREFTNLKTVVVNE
jgi:succinate-semialdehyde dehydrogenase/glutarate-semialdehyde dehydrogenase